jgi:hypothetical protein
VYHPVDQITIRDRVSGFAQELQVLQVLFRTIVLIQTGGVCLDVVFLRRQRHLLSATRSAHLHEQRDERKVVKVKLDLVVQSLLVGPREGIRTCQSIDNGERRQDSVLLVDLDPARSETPAGIIPISQLLPLVKVHFTLAKFKCRQHVQHLSDIRIGAFDQLVDDVWWDLQLLPAV